MNTRNEFDDLWMELLEWNYTEHDLDALQMPAPPPLTEMYDEAIPPPSVAATYYPFGEPEMDAPEPEPAQPEPALVPGFPLRATNTPWIVPLVRNHSAASQRLFANEPEISDSDSDSDDEIDVDVPRSEPRTVNVAALHAARIATMMVERGFSPETARDAMIRQYNMFTNACLPSRI